MTTRKPRPVTTAKVLQVLAGHGPHTSNTLTAGFCLRPAKLDPRTPESQAWLNASLEVAHALHELETTGQITRIPTRSGPWWMIPADARDLAAAVPRAIEEQAQLQAEPWTPAS